MSVDRFVVNSTTRALEIARLALRDVRFSTLQRPATNVSKNAAERIERQNVGRIGPSAIEGAMTKQAATDG